MNIIWGCYLRTSESNLSNLVAPIQATAMSNARWMGSANREEVEIQLHCSSEYLIRGIRCLDPASQCDENIGHMRRIVGSWRFTSNFSCLLERFADKTKHLNTTRL